MSDTEQAILMWVIVAVAAVAVEMFTMAFVAIYIAIGAVAAALVAWGDYGTAAQLLAFGAASLLLLVTTRPFLKKKVDGPKIASNVQALEGKRGIVTIPIDEDANSGQVRIGTEFWTARLAEDTEQGVVPEGAKVEVVSVSGVTARVRPLASE